MKFLLPLLLLFFSFPVRAEEPALTFSDVQVAPYYSWPKGDPFNLDYEHSFGDVRQYNTELNRLYQDLDDNSPFKFCAIGYGCNFTDPGGLNEMTRQEQQRILDEVELKRKTYALSLLKLREDTSRMASGEAPVTETGRRVLEKTEKAAFGDLNTTIENSHERSDQLDRAVRGRLIPAQEAASHEIRYLRDENTSIAENTGSRILAEAKEREQQAEAGLDFAPEINTEEIGRKLGERKQNLPVPDGADHFSGEEKDGLYEIGTPSDDELGLELRKALRRSRQLQSLFFNENTREKGKAAEELIIRADRAGRTGQVEIEGAGRDLRSAQAILDFHDGGKAAEPYLSEYSDPGARVRFDLNERIHDYRSWQLHQTAGAMHEAMSEKEELLKANPALNYSGLLIFSTLSGIEAASSEFMYYRLKAFRYADILSYGEGAFLAVPEIGADIWDAFTGLTRSVFGADFKAHDPVNFHISDIYEYTAYIIENHEYLLAKIGTDYMSELINYPNLSPPYREIKLRPL